MKRKLLLFYSIIGMLFASNIQAQTGFIYVHKKTLSEEVSVPFPFNITGGPTSVGAFNLNDNTTYLNVLDIGASHTTNGSTVVGNGQLWAVTDQKGLPNALNVSTGVPHYDGGEIYMRPAGSSQWITTGQTGINIDGAGPNQLMYTNSSKDAYYYAFGGSANRIWGQANHGGHGLIDIGVGFPSVTAGIRDDGHLMVYTGNYTNGSDSWNDLTPGGANLSRVDVDATSGQIVTQGSDYVIRVFPTNGSPGFTTLPLPTTAPFSTYDVTVDDNGQIYAIYFAPSGVNAGPAIYRYNSGSMTWTFEPGSANFAAATASGTQVWGVNQKGLASNARTIYARVTDGSMISYIDDERVRPAGTADNSILIPVAAGTYTLTEGAVSGWDLNAITIYDPTSNSTKNVASNTSVLNVAAGEVVQVIYTNELVTTATINNSCATQYIETFGSGTATYAPPVAGITPYHYVADKHPEDGYYTIEQSGTSYIGSASAPTEDHTPASIDGANPGYFMLVDAGLAQDEYYRKRITGLVVGQSYTLAFWAADAAPGFPARPDVTFGVADVNSGVFINSVSTGQMSNTYWKQYQFVFTATNTTLDVVLRNNTTGVYGNDIYIDDITLNGTPAPIAAISGPTTVCSIPGSNNYTYSNTVAGGVWSVLPASLASINASTGVLTTVASASGTATVTYTVNTGGCQSTAALDITVSNTNCSPPNPTYTIGGNVFDDGNGLTDNTVNISGSGALNPVDGTNLNGTPLYATLVNSSNAVVQTVPVTSTGTYSFTGVVSGTYSVVLSTNPAGSLTPSLPASYTNTGENLGTGTGSDGTVNGILTGITVSGAPITNANFGIDKAPVVVAAVDDPKVNPGGTATVPVSSTVFSGSDQEDGNYPTNLTGRTVTLTPATNGTLYYNGNPVNTTQVITNFDPTKVSLDPTATGATTGTGGTNPDPTFTYSVLDDAGVESAPATVRVPFITAMPVSLISFTAQVEADRSVLVNWKTSWERNNLQYIIERSKDLKSFEQVGQVSDVAGTSNSINTYQFVDKNPYRGTSYYRLRQVDRDGTSQPFKAEAVIIEGRYGAYPNPVLGSEFTLQLDEPLNAVLHLYDISGREISIEKKPLSELAIQVSTSSRLATGIYLMTVEERGSIRAYRLVVQ